MHLVYRNGRPYLYRSVRRNGRVTSEYIISGEPAVSLARRYAQERDADAARFDADRALEAELEDYCARVEELARATLYANGYHQHHRQWRRRHVRRPDQQSASHD